MFPPLIRKSVVLAAAVLVTAGFSCAEQLPRRTALDDYIHNGDTSWSWTVHSVRSADGMTTVVVDMVSQTWLTEKEVSRPVWRHWLTVSIPDQVSSDIGMLFISGGSNGKGPRSNERTEQIARATGTVVAQLGMVPNQPLEFHQDGKQRVEDDLIGYTWDQYLKTGNPVWPARNPMVKSAVRAMDTVTALMASETGGYRVVDRFVVAGGSKRGWTTWLTGAVDERVVAIIPIVIDVLNADPSMRHHFAAYGFWAPNVGNYVDHRIMQRLDHPRLKELYRLVDPIYYRHRLHIPKMILNAAGDQFFLPDSSRFYWDELRGEKYLRYVANGDHGLDGTDAAETIIAFYSLILSGRKPPEILWTQDDDGTLRVMSRTEPQEVRLWQAHNPEARDFRVETLGRRYTSTILQPDDDGLYVGRVEEPKQGWTAWFVELTFDVGAPTPLKLTTQVSVAPDILPFADKDPQLPTSVTLVCTLPEQAAATDITDSVRALIDAQKLADGTILTRTVGRRCYVNWVPRGDFRIGARVLAEFLTGKGCTDFAWQLESGRDITFPPATASRAAR